ncbi:hypothetical protein EIN_253520 [Entamoeba invadens IP1]|uniref:Rho-GAP domain-containing protein n=1 Tax=Entamoeba invadens IP1 TaxID=370355 RepID=A0A0A1UF20_ENTIV|nr:hypothetical protein EIN_253520 [Entamoeba invadens IP1]ELP95078.1 hypothetical protein EIN_253520 [Entamoeba invadens IP1]|eukprot:XP_004261849.1 hypothetical protein EIN_253520 [Entamoeba invadens IP1]
MTERVGMAEEILLLLNKTKFVEAKVELNQHKGKTYLFIDKKPKVNLNKSIVSREVQVELPSDIEKAFCFEVVYNKQYVFMCKSEYELNIWINKLSLEANAWGVFGYPLESSVKKCNWRFPIPVFRSIEYLEKNGGKTMEGIFRLSASFINMSKVKEILDNDQDVDMDSFGDCKVASVILKDYIRSLPNPLIPFDYYDNYINLPKRSIDPKLFIESLPLVNQDTLFIICNLLNDIITNESQTKMNAANLATCIGLTICRPPQPPKMDELVHTKIAIAAFEFLLNNFEPIFYAIRIRNENSGVYFPKYPCIIPHQKVPFSKITSIVKSALNLPELPTTYPQVRPVNRNKSTFFKGTEIEEKNMVDSSKSESLSDNEETEKSEKKEKKSQRNLKRFNSFMNLNISPRVDGKRSDGKKGTDKCEKLEKNEKVDNEKQDDELISTRQKITEMQINRIEDLKKEIMGLKNLLQLVTIQRDGLIKKYEPDLVPIEKQREIIETKIESPIRVRVPVIVMETPKSDVVSNYNLE